MRKNKVDIITLGCSKNLVDSEQLMRQFVANGYTVEHDPHKINGEIVVVNTCGFIGDAQEESINMILELGEAKKKGKIGHPLLNRSIERAQKTIENQHYSSRKRMLQFDDVINKQREIIYGLRNEALSDADVRPMLFDFIKDELDERIASAIPATESAQDADYQALCSWVTSRFPIAIIPEQLKGKSADEMREVIVNEIEAVYKIREEVEDPEALKAIERFVLLRALDKNWQDHLTEMEDLRRSIGLRGYGQKDPLNEYKSEAYKYFESLMSKIRNDICLGLFRSASSLEVLQAMIEKMQRKFSDRAALAGAEQARESSHKPADGEPKKEIKLPDIKPRTELPKIGRNENVVIEKNGERVEMKFKKAEPLILNEGWRLVKW